MATLPPFTVVDIGEFDETSTEEPAEVADSIFTENEPDCNAFSLRF